MILATTVYLENDKINSYTTKYTEIYEFFANIWKDELDDLAEECQKDELWDVNLLNLNIIKLVDLKTKPKIIVKGEPLYSIYLMDEDKFAKISREDLIVYLMRYILEF